MTNVRKAIETTAKAAALVLGLTGGAMAREQILISSEWGNVNAELVENEATRSLVKMLPVTIDMRDHLRQEKTGNLPSPLAPSPRQIGFSKGTLGLWDADHFVIYYKEGRVPQPGIVILGQVTGDVSIFDRPGRVKVHVELAPK
jgi:hypothetical protein